MIQYTLLISIVIGLCSLIHIPLKKRIFYLLAMSPLTKYNNFTNYI